MNIREKLALILSPILLVIFAILFTLLWSQQKLEWQRNSITHSFSELVQIETIYSQIQRQLKEVSDMMLFGEDDKEYTELKTRVSGTFETWKKLTLQGKKYGFPMVEKELKSIADLKRNYSTILENTQEALELRREGQREKALELLEKILEKDFEDQFSMNIEILIANEKFKVNKLDMEANELTGFINALSYFLIGLTIFFSVLIVVASRRKIIKPVEDLKKGAQKIGKGEFDVKVEVRSNDEIGDLANTFNMMSSNLKQTTFSRDYVDNIFKTMTDALLVVNLEEIVQTVNQAACDLLGYREDELIGKEVGLFFETAEEGEISNLSYCHTFFKTLIKEGVLANLEQTLISKNGQKIPVLFSGSVMRDGQGKIQGIVCVLKDITERKQLEGQIKEALKQNKLVLDTVGEGICGIDIYGNITFFNPAAEEMTGYTSKEVMGKNCHDLIHHSKIDGTPCSWEECAFYQIIQKGTKDKNAEEIFWRKDGTSFPVDCTRTASWEEGKIVGGALTFRDSSERKRILGEQKELLKDFEEREGLIRSVLENIQDALVAIDETGIIRIFNTSAERSFGYSPSEIVGKNIKMLMPKSYHKRHDEGFMRYLSTGESEVIGTVLEVRGKRKNNTIFPLELVVTEVFQKGKRLFVGTMRDQSARKKAEEELEKSRKLLFRSEKLSAIGTLSSGVAHEILNPLNIINVITQMELKKDHPSCLKERLEKIMAQVYRATSITNTLREFAHPGVGKIAKLNIHGVFDKSASLIEHELKAENISIVRFFDEDLPEIEADEDKLEQIFLNLLNNARDALQNRPDSKIIVKTKLLNDDRIEFRFSDTGAGIPEGNFENLFDPFFTTKEPGKGTGLGLAIIHEIVEKASGSIRVENGKNEEGAIFTIQLPIKHTKASKSDK